jgi:hypothetical protein
VSLEERRHRRERFIVRTVLGTAIAFFPGSVTPHPVCGAGPRHRLIAFDPEGSRFD